jgi:hypothetical protein
MFTGLSMGQTRPLDELRAALNSEPGRAPSPLPDTLQPGPATTPVTTTGGQQAKKRATLPESLNPEPLLAKPISTEEQWAAYLKQKNLVQWAQKNPQMANKLRERLFPMARP